MNAEHPFYDQIPAYALGAADEETVAVLEAHLRSCETCREELAAYQSVSNQLLFAASPRVPPSRLRQKLQSRLPGERRVRFFNIHWSLQRVALASAIALLIALNIYTLIRVQVLSRQQVALALKSQSEQAALSLLSSAGTVTIPVAAGNLTGTVLLNPSQNAAVLVVWNLPELPPDQTFQAWLIDAEGKRTSAGIFQQEAGESFTSAQLLTPGALSAYVGLGVTVEPSGGSSQPTGQRIFKVDF